MLSDSLPDRDKVFMSDRSYRPLPHVEEVGEHLQLSVRSFPDGSCRISFSLRGLWAIGFSTDPFSEWAKAAIERLRDRPDGCFIPSDGKEDFYVDASEFLSLETNFSGRRMRAALVLVNDAVVKQAVASGIRAEVIEIFGMADSEAREKRFRELYGVEVSGHLSGLSSHVAAPGVSSPSVEVSEVASDGPDLSGGGASGSKDDPGQGLDDADSETWDFERLVPVVERQLGGRVGPTVIARDMHTFLGSGDRFRQWFLYQAERCKLIEGQDYVDGFLREIPQKSKRGARPKEFLITLRAAKEIGMVGSSHRSKALRLYFIDCERRLYAGEGPPPGVVLPAEPGGNEVARPEPQYAWRPREVLDSTFYAPEGRDHGLTAETLPMTLFDFLVLSRIPAFYAATVAPRLEQELCGDSLFERVRNGVARQPVDGRIFFARAVLDAWWMKNAEDVVRGAKNDSLWVFSRGINPPR